MRSEEEVNLSSIEFVLDGRVTSIRFGRGEEYSPTTTVLNYLRSLPTHKGVKEGCAEGDCGACTVVLGELSQGGSIKYKSVDSCLLFLPMIHRKLLVTVENLKSVAGELHPVQSAMVETNGSQCGFCTPGIVMSLFSLYKSKPKPSKNEIEDHLTGNLCRCTGYKPIIEAAAKSTAVKQIDEHSRNESGLVHMLQNISIRSLELQTDTQQYFRPVGLAEALNLKREYPEAVIISGATDVALRVTKNNELITQIIDFSGIEELQFITEDKSSIRIGAGVVLSDVKDKVDGIFPACAEALSVFGSRQIRNVATLGGNLGTASPISDTLSALIPFGARLVLQNADRAREVELATYVTGYRRTVRQADELIVAVVLPKLLDDSFIKWYKVSRRKDLDISTLSAGFRLERDAANVVNAVQLVYGGMADRVKSATKAEEFLTGKPWTRQNVEEAMKRIDEDFNPISDVRGSATFRKVAARNLLLKFWNDTVEAKRNGETQ